MKFGEHSPPALPTHPQQRDALQKGLGRAMLWAINGRLEEQSLLDACLIDQRLDTQSEKSRGAWLWRLIQAREVKDRFRTPILHSLQELANERNAHQLCEIGRFYALTGDERFRTRLYEIVEQKPFATIPWLGEKELIELDGEVAFVFAAQLRGQGLTQRDWDEHDDGSFVESAVKHFGENRLNQLLDSADAGAIRVFHETWQQQKNKTTGQNARELFRKQLRAMTVHDIIAAAESEAKNIGRMRGWGMHADPADLNAVLQYLWTTRNPKAIADLLNVFSNRAFPVFDARLIELRQHADQEVRQRALMAMAINAHPSIRDYALTELAGEPPYWGLIALFINNFQPGDEQKILEAIQLSDNLVENHWLLMEVTKVLKKNTDAKCFELGVISYAMTPCQNCRFEAARLLQNHRLAPSWLTEECAFDSNEDFRQLTPK